MPPDGCARFETAKTLSDADRAVITRIASSALRRCLPEPTAEQKS